MLDALRTAARRPAPDSYPQPRDRAQTPLKRLAMKPGVKNRLARDERPSGDLLQGIAGFGKSACGELEMVFHFVHRTVTQE